MKSVFVACSRKFFNGGEEVIRLCRDNGIRAANAGKLPDHDDTFESEKSALIEAFRRIDSSEILYVVARNGYIGKTVAIEIAYAFAKGKEIVSSEELEELSARSLISGVMKPGELIEHIKSL
jgi:hypothetical protein